jgi:hypothetical protein
MKRKRKQSIVVFEDWVKYSKFLTGDEFKELILSIFKYYDDQMDPQFEGNLAIVWENIIDDIQVNLSHKSKRQENIAKARKTSPIANPNIKSQTSELEPKLNPEPKSKLSPFERIINKSQDQPKSVAPEVSTNSPQKKIKMNIKPKSKQMPQETNTSELTKEFFAEKLNNTSSNDLIKAYPEHSDVILDALADLIRSL